MKLLAILFTLVSITAHAHDHATKHGMVIYGEGRLFASHIVYKSPHNYQVILKLTMDPVIQQTIHTAQMEHPKEQLTFLLDTMVIKDIDTVAKISGPVFREDSTGQQTEVVPKLEIERKDFEIIYFSELPL